jgi:DNA gyrase subunit A
MEMNIGTVMPVKIEEEMRSSYLDYAMSVIVSRALPDVRDGLKPVQRRILYAMRELGIHHNTPYKKSARIVGEVLGKYHPHGDAPVYEALVRMAQDFSMRYQLIDGQGNFGSIDDDPPAAMRYTEARLAEIAQEMVADIDKDTVDFVPNFDGSLKEPVVLSARLPNLLLNGSSGIAVGMATNIPPHNLSEVCDAIAYLVDNPEASVSELMEFIPGPDFPTGGVILGQEQVQRVYNLGQGKIVIRAKVSFEETQKEGRRQIVVTELPYQTNKAALLERIAELIKEKKIEGISELRDESDRQGIRVVIELRKEAQPEQVLNNLYKHTAMQSAFFVNMLALVQGQPQVLNLKEMLQHYIDFRQQVIVRRTRFELTQAKERAHILEGLKIALDSIDQVIATIRRSQNAEAARRELMHRFGLSQPQAQAILDMQLRRLAALEREKILEEYEQLLKTISRLEDLLASPRKVLLLIKEEVQGLKAKYGDSRRTQLSQQEVREFQAEDLIPHQKMVVTLSTRGYIKRVPCDLYRQQRRGGKGVTGVPTREAEAVRLLAITDTHDRILFFSNRGRAFGLKCYQIPGDSSRTAKGMPLTNLLSLDSREQITAMVGVSNFDSRSFLLLATRRGEIKKTPLREFTSARSKGLIAMNLKEGDELIGVRLAAPGDEVIMMTEKGQAIRFSSDNLRAASRNSGGVRGIKLAPDDRVISMDMVSHYSHFLVVTARGFGKLTPLNSFPLQSRGGKGVRGHKVTPKTGRVAASCPLSLSHEVLLVSSEGIVLRLLAGDIPRHDRNTQGVSLMKLDKGDEVVSVDCFSKGEDRLRESCSAIPGEADGQAEPE